MADLNNIKDLIKSEDYERAFSLIETELERHYDILDEKEEKKYSELLKLRVTTNTLMGEDDPIILDIVRKEKYPSENRYYIEINKELKFCIKLIDKGNFLSTCDAYINTVAVNNPFTQITDRSATSEFVKKLRLSNIQKQLSKYHAAKKSDFVMLNHRKLSAPISYHILFYEDEGIDLDALELGIKKVLKDACKKKLQTIGFFPLGYAWVTKVAPNKRKEMAATLANKIAESIVSFVYENSEKPIPEIRFNFVTMLTMETFGRAFAKWTCLNKSEVFSIQQFSTRQKSLIESARTTDPKYLKILGDLFMSVDEKSSILLLGETGVGKTYLAEQIHKNSIRHSEPFIDFNCALFRPEHIYTHLFGWKKGSFNNATDDGPGIIPSVKGGTLFLDEIGYTDIRVQRMLLKFIESGKYSRFGEQEKVLTANIRLIFGTNIDIEQYINDGLFAPDLFERISKRPITIPPLRERINDLDLLTRHFLLKLNELNNADIQISSDAIQKLKTFYWPGNIRQLESYFANLYDKANHTNSSEIIRKWIESDLPRNVPYTKNPYWQIENYIKEIMKNWKSENGSILNFIKTVIAKVYLEDLKGTKKDSMSITGFDGTSGEKSTINKEVNKYHKLKEKLFKNL